MSSMYRIAQDKEGKLYRYIPKSGLPEGYKDVTEYKATYKYIAKIYDDNGNLKDRYRSLRRLGSRNLNNI